ncbi:MAG TPA: translation initiation factor IF-2 N-terminal domain-containing protein, partial [Thermoanaerobaculia bacterium]|nr:translation initiation factor IF-2 N-terminal domain-containing protein [Thermoanaerobaculia bacterium]
MGKSEKDVIFQLQSLGAEVSDPSQVLEPEVIQALITGKKLTMRTRSVIMREDKPQVEKKKEAVRPPRPIVQPPARKKTEAPKGEEPVAAPAPPSVIIPEFLEAAEAEERAAKEAPPAPAPPPPAEKVEKPRVAAETPRTDEVATPPAPRPEVPAEPRPAAPPAGQHDRRPTGPTGPRARVPQAARPNYAGQPTPPQQQRPSAPGAPRPSAPMGARPAGPGAPRPAGAGGSGSYAPGGARPSGPGGPRPGGPMGARPAGPGMRGPGGPGLRPGGSGRPMGAPPPPPMPGANIIRRKKEDQGTDERGEKKKTTGKRGKTVRGAEFDQELLTKGPFSGTQVIADDLGPDIVMPDVEDEGPKRVSSRRDARKQAAPTGRVLEFKRPTGKVALTEGVTVKELAEKLDVKANDLMKHLFMKKGLMVSINQPLGADLALEVAKELGIDAEMVSFEEAIELEAIERSDAAG